MHTNDPNRYQIYCYMHGFHKRTIHLVPDMYPSMLLYKFGDEHRPISYYDWVETSFFQFLD